MNTYRLRTKTRRKMDNLLREAGFLSDDDDGAPVYRNGVAVLGKLQLKPARIDGAGNELSAAVIDERWHVDIFADSLPEVLETYQVFPAKPRHVFWTG